MDILLDLGKILLPAALALYAMYLVVRSFVQKELDAKRLEVRAKSIETVLPNRLHAYERICLFLERISPNSLILRLNNGQYSAREFQQLLLNEIREEYNHNVSQQVYMSEEVWTLVKTAKEELIMTINDASSSLDDKATSIDLAKKIFEKMMGKEVDPIQHALLQLKSEIRQTF
jgi:hypothetical protein